MFGDPLSDELIRRVSTWAQSHNLSSPQWRGAVAAPKLPSPWRSVATYGPTAPGPVGAPGPPGSLTGAVAPVVNAPPTAAPEGPLPHHLDPNYTGWGTPNLEWWGLQSTLPAVTGNPWKADVPVGGLLRHWRRDYDPRTGLIYGEQ